MRLVQVKGLPILDIRHGRGQKVWLCRRERIGGEMENTVGAVGSRHAARLSWIAGAALLAAVTAARAGQPHDHDLIPTPRELAWGPGALVLGPSTRLAVAGRCDARVERALDRAA